MDVDVPAFSVRDQGGHMRGIWENRADAEAYLANPPNFIDPTRSTIVPATTVRQQQVPTTEPTWFARLTPEMKARILKEGLPLMSLLPLAAWVASQEPPPSDADLIRCRATRSVRSSGGRSELRRIHRAAPTA